MLLCFGYLTRSAVGSQPEVGGARFVTEVSALGEARVHVTFGADRIPVEALTTATEAADGQACVERRCR